MSKTKHAIIQQTDIMRRKGKSLYKCENCKTNKIESKLEKEIKLAILKKATIMEKEGFDSYYEKIGKNKAKTLRDN